VLSYIPGIVRYGLIYDSGGEVRLKGYTNSDRVMSGEDG
jgi:hypothetical protein